MKHRTFLALCFMFSLLLATNSHSACLPAAISTIYPNITATAPGRDAPVITAMSPWYYDYLSGPFYRCSIETTTVSIEGNINTPQIQGYYIDPDDGQRYAIYNFSDGGGVGIVIAAGPDASQLLSVEGPNYKTFSTMPTPNGDLGIATKYRLVRYALPSQNFIRISGFSQVHFRWKTASTSLSTAYYLLSLSIITPLPTTSTQTCAVITKNISVALPNITSLQLGSANGSTAGETPFTIPISCPNQVNLYMTVTDNSNPGQTGNIINLNSNATAKGVGIQIKKNGQVIAMGPDSSIAYNPNQFFIGYNQQGTISIPFTAQYIKTGTVQGGTTTAVATFTLSYQ